MKAVLKKSILLIFTALAFSYCTTVPITGRKQLKFMPDSELLAMSFSQYNQFLSQNRLSTNQNQINMVRTVGLRIQQAVETYMAEKGMADRIKDFRWEFNLVEDRQVNAFCMPGGKVVIYTGILPICRDENGLAIVMGHEIAHAIAEHGNERMSQTLLANGLLTAGGVIVQSKNPSLTNQLLLQAAGVVTNLGLLSFSRQHESEADKIGLIFSSMAGYDPRDAPSFWQRMAGASNGQKPPEFLSTHPSHERRISDLEAMMPEAMAYYEKSINRK
ncbi:MAG: M48 family metallopeptidase [Thermoflexibacter sp.]|jgi:predicted Zn-dependent protease|nr:M48 family metallopeptidase [Thermoflexibacter sp.]